MTDHQGAHGAPCPRCDGWGRLHDATGGEWFDCEECGGTGATPVPRPGALPAGRAPIAIPRGEWKWYGHAAHLIVGQSCRFHLATEIGEYLVSTVGEYWPERAVREIHAQVHDPSWLAGNRHRRGDDFDAAYMTRFGFEEIGCDRKYETMVFRLSGERCTRPDCGCGLPAPTSWGELDSDGYNDAGAATAGHLALCEKFAALAAVERASQDGAR